MEVSQYENSQQRYYTQRNSITEMMCSIEANRRALSSTSEVPSLILGLFWGSYSVLHPSISISITFYVVSHTLTLTCVFQLGVWLNTLPFTWASRCFTRGLHLIWECGPFPIEHFPAFIIMIMLWALFFHWSAIFSHFDSNCQKCDVFLLQEEL